jgi:hypothetical protein
MEGNILCEPPLLPTRALRRWAEEARTKETKRFFRRDVRRAKQRSNKHLR